MVTQFVAIFSDNDPFVPLSEEKLFKSELGAQIIVLHGKGHLQQEHDVFILPEILPFF